LRAVFPLQQAVLKASSSPEHLTPIHPDFLQVCLQAKVYNAALPVLEQEILDIDPASTNLTPQDMLRYFYYGGNVYIGLKQYKKALEMFKLVSIACSLLNPVMLLWLAKIDNKTKQKRSFRHPPLH